jgi:hypothetical protein
MKINLFRLNLSILISRILAINEPKDHLLFKRSIYHILVGGGNQTTEEVRFIIVLNS